MTTEFLGIMIRILQENDQKILINIQIKKLDDYGILMKFQRDFDQNSFQDLNDHGILQGIQMATEFFKDFDQNYFQELDDH